MLEMLKLKVDGEEDEDGEGGLLDGSGSFFVKLV